MIQYRLIIEQNLHILGHPLVAWILRINPIFFAFNRSNLGVGKVAISGGCSALYLLFIVPFRKSSSKTGHISSASPITMVSACSRVLSGFTGIKIGFYGTQETFLRKIQNHGEGWVSISKNCKCRINKTAFQGFRRWFEDAVVNWWFCIFSKNFP